MSVRLSITSQASTPSTDDQKLVLSFKRLGRRLRMSHLFKTYGRSLLEEYDEDRERVALAPPLVTTFEEFPVMRALHRRELFATMLAAAGLLTTASRVQAMPGNETYSSTDPRWDMVSALGAAGPHLPRAPDADAKLFDGFVGTWDCDYSFISPDGSVRRSSGELLFGWVMDGHALQDIWISYPQRGVASGRLIGTSVRFFDPIEQIWRIVFIAPQARGIIQVSGKSEADRIVLHGTDTGGANVRWSFNDIEADSFTWRGESSTDGGATWVLQEEHHMRRRMRR
jgi:hypothetical protein